MYVQYIFTVVWVCVCLMPFYILESTLMCVQYVSICVQLSLCSAFVSLCVWARLYRHLYLQYLGNFVCSCSLLCVLCMACMCISIHECVCVCIVNSICVYFRYAFGTIILNKSITYICIHIVSLHVCVCVFNSSTLIAQSQHSPREPVCKSLSPPVDELYDRHIGMWK